MDNLNLTASDYETLEKLAESADRRAKEHYGMALSCKSTGVCECDYDIEVDYTCQYHSLLNDFFYWSGKATAYKGIAAGLALRGVVEEEIDAEPSCP